MSDERREFQRLNLVRPLDGWFGDYAVRLLDVSAGGALVESDETLPTGARALLRFYWRGEELELLAETARRDDSRVGVAFIDDSDDLRRIIALSATELLRAQEANAGGQRERNVIEGDATLTAASSMHHTGYVTWIFSEGQWTRRHSLIADQPPDGFTIAAGEAEEQVAMLRETYESGDTEARRLTRLLAEISVASR